MYECLDKAQHIEKQVENPTINRREVFLFVSSAKIFITNNALI